MLHWLGPIHYICLLGLANRNSEWKSSDQLHSTRIWIHFQCYRKPARGQCPHFSRTGKYGILYIVTAGLMVYLRAIRKIQLDSYTRMIRIIICMLEGGVCRMLKETVVSNVERISFCCLLLTLQISRCIKAPEKVVGKVKTWNFFWVSHFKRKKIKKYSTKLVANFSTLLSPTIKLDKFQYVKSMQNAVATRCKQTLLSRFDVAARTLLTLYIFHLDEDLPCTQIKHW
jgi:hypothetical protein